MESAVTRRWRDRHNVPVTILSRSGIQPQAVTVQCDFCCPPALATNRLEVLLASGWQLGGGEGPDRCAQCRHERPGLTPRAERFGPGAGGRLPDLLLIGAAKCGTTSLHAYLDQHPDVAMAELKELRFFQDPDGARWQSWYEAQFDPTARVVGESSTMYTRSPALPGCAERMAALVADARLIYMVRDPIDRAIASYQEERFQELEPRSIEAAFADLDDPYNPYVSASRYHEQLQSYRSHFSDEQILVLPLADLERDPEATMSRVFAFIGVDDTIRVGTDSRLNVGAAKYEYPGLAGRLRRSAVGAAVRRLPPGPREALQSRARRLLSRPLERPVLDAELRERLRDALAPDAARLRALTGLDLADWSV